MGGSNHQPQIAIIGAGIGGLALAIGLTRQNVAYTIYEAGPEFSAVGAGIAFGPNSLRAMALISPALREMYNNISTGNRSPEKVHVFADFMLAEPGFGVNRGWEGASVGSKDFTKSGAHRKDLLDVMTQLFPTENVRFGKRAVEVRQVGEKASIHFEDGEVVEADAVIGCDGGKGVTRNAVLATNYPEEVAAIYSGRYVYRAIVPQTEAQNALGKYADDGKMFVGPGCYFALYQMSGGRSNLVAARQKGGQWVHSQWTKEVTREDMIADFDGCDPRLLELLRWANPMRWALFHHPSTSTYRNGRIVILGDAAHASTPHQGSGAGQCLEDALILSHLIGMAKDVSHLNAAFETYDMICRPRGQEIVRTSNEAGHLYTLTHPECGEDISKVVENANRRFQWIWTHDLEAELKRAEERYTALQNKV